MDNAPKTILCIRHGESTFNAIYRDTGLDPLHTDARLSELGERQVIAAREALRGRPVDLVVASPLTRAMQTALGIFGDHPSRPTMIVEPLHRERVESSCDVGRAPAILAAEFPMFDLGALVETWWHEDGSPNEIGVCVEPVAVLEQRIEAFKAWLRARPEAAIAVVGHGTFFYHLTGQFLKNCETVEYALEPGAARL